MNTENRCIPVLNIFVRRIVIGLLGIGQLRTMPISLVVLPVREPVLFCLEIHRCKVEGTIMRDESLEALVMMTCEIIDGETSEAGSNSTQFIFIDIGQILRSIVDGSQIVFHALTCPVARDLFQPLLSEARQTATVGGYDDIAL